MDRVRALLREPALLIDAFESLVVVLIALGMFNLTGDQQTNVVALFIAILAFVKGFFTRPFPVTVVTDLGRAGAVFCVSLGILHWTPDQVTLVVTFLGTLMTIVQRAQITPRYDPVSRPGGAGAGPLAGREEVGEAALGFIGYLLLVIGIVLLIVSLFGLVPFYWGLILIVIGAVLWVLDRGHTRV